MKKTSDAEPVRCEECGGCVDCQERFCPFYPRRGREDCFPEMCRYCAVYFRRNRLFLNNVG